MTMPTNEHIKEFWEWCGFKSRLVWSDPADIVPRHQFKVWDYPDGSGVTQHLSVNPSIDLNNLFKYAVPKLQAQVKGLVLSLCDSCSQPEYHADIYGEYLKGEKLLVNKTNADPALALFWAIYGVMK